MTERDEITALIARALRRRAKQEGRGMQFSVTTSGRNVVVNGQALTQRAARMFSCCLAAKAQASQDSGELVRLDNQYTHDKGLIEPGDAFAFAGEVFSAACKIGWAECEAARLSCVATVWGLTPEADQPTTVMIAE